MKRTIPGGLLCAVEGIDGAGKSTLLPVLKAWCEGEGLPCAVSREPTDGPWGRKLRASAAAGRMVLEEELECFLQDRREHVAAVIAPALRAGTVVLLDRYYFSTAAYQGARGADPVEILRANEVFAPRPDLVLLLEVPPHTGLSRVRERGHRPDEFEREDELLRVQAIFSSLSFPGLVRLDASAPHALVQEGAVSALRTAVAKKMGLAHSS